MNDFGSDLRTIQAIKLSDLLSYEEISFVDDAINHCFDRGGRRSFPVFQGKDPSKACAKFGSCFPDGHGTESSIPEDLEPSG